MRFPQVLENRYQAIKAATPLTRDVAVVTPHRLYTLVLAEQLRVTLQAIRRYDEEIAQLARQNPDYELFSALPGAGPSLAPRLLVAFGEQRDRFTSAAEVQKCSGVAPVTERSGHKNWVHWRW
jgi:transposase